MAVTQYIGARYVPLFAEPLEWDITKKYEPLTIVYYQGNSYTSKQSVPTNIDISDTNFWALTGNYNAQIEQYRREVENITKNYIGFIGDSWTYNKNWVNNLANKLSLTPINEARGSAGFTSGVTGEQFIQQLDRIKVNPNFTKMKYLIVYGGINDKVVARASSSQVINACRDFLNNWNNIQGYKPELIFAFGNVGYAVNSSYNDFAQWYRNVIDGLRAMGMPGIVDNVAYWHMGLPIDTFDSTYNHPSETGYNIIESFFESILAGGYNGVHRSWQFTGNNPSGIKQCDNYYCKLNFDNGLVTLNSRLTNVDVEAAFTRYNLTENKDIHLSFGEASSTEGINYIEARSYNGLSFTYTDGNTSISRWGDAAILWDIFNCRLQFVFAGSLNSRTFPIPSFGASGCANMR